VTEKLVLGKVSFGKNAALKIVGRLSVGKNVWKISLSKNVCNIMCRNYGAVAS
jgi:hypothetical protein